jgi:hypothetical protein
MESDLFGNAGGRSKPPVVTAAALHKGGGIILHISLYIAIWRYKEAIWL